MKTPTHWALGYLATRWPPLANFPRRAVLAGAVLPDTPLILVWLALAAWSRGQPPGTLRAAMDRVYFGDPLFITAHHLFHSPASIMLLAVFALQARRAGMALARPLAGFLAGAACHVAADVPSHRADAALILWPIDWSLRPPLGLSQWDGPGAPLLLTVEAAICAVAALVWLRRRSDTKPPLEPRASGPIERP